MQVHFMVPSEKHSTLTHALEIKKRMNSVACTVFYGLSWALFGAYILFLILSVKNRYQMNPANYREALVEAHEDEAEGADILLVSTTLLRNFEFFFVNG